MRLHLTYKSLIALIVVSALVYALLFYDVTKDYYAKKAELAELKQYNTSLVAQNEKLSRELEFVQSSAGVEMYAHEYGWQYPNEICYNAVVPGSN